MIWIAYFIYGFLVLRLMVSMTNLLTRQWLRNVTEDGAGFSITGQRRGVFSPSGNLHPYPLVSVLIPARNEEKKIGNLLNDILMQDYENLEILVYNDLSEDNTSRLVKKFMEKDSRIRLIEGSPLPSGWLGKNNACHRLGMSAKGEYLLFLDADVRIGPRLVRRGLAHLHLHRLDLLSLFPKQEMVTFGEKTVVPIMNWVLVGLLPLILTRISSWTSFSAANGQFMMFRAVVYQRFRFHEELKGAMVEDIEIFRLMKEKGLRTHTALGSDEITCRMYGSWREAIEGFSKNVLEYFGGHALMAILFALLTTLGFVPVLLYLPGRPFLIFLLLMIINRVITSFLSGQPVLLNILLAPFQQLSLWVMIIRALMNKTRHSMTWKGRNLYNLNTNAHV